MLKIGVSRRRLYLVLFLLALYLFITRAAYFAQRIYPFPHRRIILAEARNNDLDPLLITAVVYVESSFAEHALSSKGARGLMQIMPETGAWAAEQLGLDGFTAEQLFEPQVNIALGAWYLHDLSQQFDDNIYLALAAYNSGPNQVRLWLQKGIWDGRLKTLREIPFPETRCFVLKVERVYRRYQWIYKEIDYKEIDCRETGCKEIVCQAAQLKYRNGPVMHKDALLSS